MKKTKSVERTKTESKAKKKTRILVKTKTKKVTTKKPAKKKVPTRKMTTKRPTKKTISKRPKKAVKVRVKKKITKKVAKKVPKKIKKLTTHVIPSIEQPLVPITPPLVKLPRIIHEPEGKIPQIHEENRIVLLARDPNWIFTYWEVGDKTLKSLQEKLPDSHIALRVYDISGTTPEKPNRFFDINVYERIGNWHIEVNQPDREFLVDIGLLSPEGTFMVTARSNKILTPRDGIEKTGMEDQITKEFYRAAYGLPMKELREELKISS